VAVDVIRLTRSYPKGTILVRRIRALLSGKPYFFNRQKMRRRVFCEIDDRIPFDNYIETGTYLGMTTHFLAKTAERRGAQVHSCEINDDYFAIASRTVGDMKNVHLRHGNSVDFLATLSPSVSKAVNFVYLDAHWYDDLPLRDELSVIGSWPNTVVMIDDFKVPFDAGFGWDKYDEEREICLRHIEGSIGSSAVYFPSYPAQREGAGIARGYCVIAVSSRYADVLDQIQLLRQFR
jgi:Methyltransferase domain